MAPWPNKPCPYCGGLITDLLAEMIEPAKKGSIEQKAIIGVRPGGAITCPYCEGAIEHSTAGELMLSNLVPLRYSRLLIEQRARDFGTQFYGNPNLTVGEWIELDKGMPGALRGYRFAEDYP
jgi:hypothetical protein